MFTSTNTRQTAAAFAGSIIMTATCFVAVGIATPAQAAPAAFKANVEQQIAANTLMPATVRPISGTATVVVRLDQGGRIVNAAIAGTSGHALLDREALRTAKAVRYPAGQAKTVAMVLSFGNAKMPAASTTQALVRKHEMQMLAASDTLTTG